MTTSQEPALTKAGYRTVPEPTTKMPRCIPFIVVNECAERFSFYGMTAILTIFLTKYLRDSSGHLSTLDENSANQINHYFNTLVYFTPLIGSLIADIFWGKYRTIFWVSLFYCLGHAAMSAGQTLSFAFVGMGLIALGAGGIKPCVSANVGDQFGPKNQNLLAKVYSWFYFAINVGAFFSQLLIPWVLDYFGHGKKYDAAGPQVAFAIPGVLMAIAALVFWMGRKKYVHVPPAGWSKVKENFSGANLKILLKLALLFLLVSPFYTLYYQNGSEWVLQADKLNLSYDWNILGMHWSGSLDASQIQAVNAFLILVFTPIFAYWVYPLVNRFVRLTPQRKIVGGMLMMVITFLPIIYIQLKLDELHSPEHMKAALVAQLQPGIPLNDGSFNFKSGENAQPVTDEGRQGLRSPDWFSYDIPIDPTHPVSITATYRNDEAADRTFDVLVNGKKIGTETVKGLKKDDKGQVDKNVKVGFYVVEYPVPPELVAGKQDLTVKFQAAKDEDDKPSAVAAVYGIASTRSDRPSYWWQVLAYALLTAAEVMVSIPILEFAYTHAPKRMKSLVMAFYFACSISAGNFIENQLSSIIHSGSLASTFFSPDPSKPSHSLIPVANFYWYFIGYMIVATVLFIIVSRLIHLTPVTLSDPDVNAEKPIHGGEPLAPSTEH